MYQRGRPLDLSRFAAIADVHGNRWALEAVLEDIAHRGIHSVVNLGDHLFGPLDPDGTAAIMMRLNQAAVAGNQDRELLESDAPQPITREQRDWLTAMPAHRVLGDILLFHGTPQSDTTYLTETVREQGVALATDREIKDRLGALPEFSLLLCGHTHVPRVVSCGERLIVNPGSVGLQAYADNTPYPHVMETGSPHARYAILERTESGWNVEQIQLRYDWDSAALTAASNGRIDWAGRLAKGRVR